MNFKNLCVTLQNRITLKLISIGLQKNSTISMCKLGSDYGGWYVPIEFCKQTTYTKTLISAGIGHDVTFEIAMQNNGFHVIAIDPIDECCEFAKNSELNQKNLEIINAGLWRNSGKALFYPPKNVNHVSWSITNSQNSPNSSALKFEVIELNDVMRKILKNNGNQLTILKLDIEGAERYLFTAIEENSNNLDFVGIEMDYLHLLPFSRFITRFKLIIETRKKLKSLNLNGFRYIHNDLFNFYWINTMTLNKLKNEKIK